MGKVLLFSFPKTKLKEEGAGVGVEFLADNTVIQCSSVHWPTWQALDARTGA